MIYFLIGIKGTGLSNLASYLSLRGDVVIGCDVEENFFTKAIISSFDIFSLDCSLPENVDTVIYSSAYENRALKALMEAKERGIPCYSYPEYLSILSSSMLTGGVSGTHGKTTTSSIASYLIKAEGARAGSVYGSFLRGDEQGVNNGSDFLVLEACEYKDHFQLYSLDALVITSMDYDHPDYFPSLEAVRDSFHERIRRLNPNAVIFADHSVYRQVASWAAERSDLKVFKYGAGAFSIVKHYAGASLAASSTGSFDLGEKTPEILGDYMAGALIYSALKLTSQGYEVTEKTLTSALIPLMPLLESYPGVTSRGDVVFEEDGVLYIDEYAHHPREISVAIESLRHKYSARRIVVLFMPHTSSRTKALMKDFVNSLSAADAVFIQRVYASARGDDEKEDQAKRLADEIEKRAFRSFYQKLAVVEYVKTDEEAVGALSAFLQGGDVAVAMGAGDNRRLLKEIKERRTIC